VITTDAGLWGITTGPSTIIIFDGHPSHVSQQEREKGCGSIFKPWVSIYSSYHKMKSEVKKESTTGSARG